MKKLIFIFLFFYFSSALAQKTLIDKIALEVNREIITLNQLKWEIIQVVEDIKKRNNISVLPSTEIEKIYENTMRNIIIENAILDKAKRFNISLTDTEIDEFIQNFARQNKISVEQLYDRQNRIYENGYNYFINKVKRVITTSKFQNSFITSKIKVSQREIDTYKELIQSDSEQNNLLFVLIPIDAQISSENQIITQIKLILDEIKIDLDQDTVNKILAINPNILVRQFKGNIKNIPDLLVPYAQSLKNNQYADTFKNESGMNIIKKIPSQINSNKNIVLYELERIIFDIQTKDEVLKEIKKIKEKLAKGESFASIASQYDKNSYLGFVIPETLGESLSTLIKKIPVGQMSSVVETAQGFQVIYNMSVKKLDEQDQIANKIKDNLFREKFFEQLKKWHNELYSSAFVVKKFEKSEILDLFN